MAQYYIFSLKAQAWVDKSGTYTSDLKTAKRFSHPEALAACQKHFDARGETPFGWIPVYDLDLIHIRDGSRT